MLRTEELLVLLQLERMLAYFDELAKHRNNIDSPVAGRATFIRQSLPSGFNIFFMFVIVLSSSCGLRGFDAMIMSKVSPSNPWLESSFSMERVLKVILALVSARRSFASFRSPSLEAEKT